MTRSTRQTRKTRQLAAWIACCAILFAVLAPSLLRATTTAPGSLLTEICTAAGMKVVQVVLSDDGEPASSTQMAHANHCIFCTGVDGAPPPPAGAPLAFAIVTVAAHPPLFYHAPRGLHHWSPAQSRAPPSLA